MDISAILVCHREGLYCGPSIKSFRATIAQAEMRGLRVERIAVLDRPDDLTKAAIEENFGPEIRIEATNAGDPADARNAGVALARGHYVSFLDGDDLWSGNWLSASFDFCERLARPVIAHSEFNIVFGMQRAAWGHADSESADFEIDYLKTGNYWDSMCFCQRDIFLQFPQRKSQFGRGYGHEDWSWNNETLASGIPHKPVPGTIHAKRRKLKSHMNEANARDVIPYKTSLDEYRISDLHGNPEAGVRPLRRTW